MNQARARHFRGGGRELSPVYKSDTGDIEKQQGTHHECREARDEKDQFQFAQRKQPAHQSETIAVISELVKRERPSEARG